MQAQERVHALDAVRAFALLLGIAFHAMLSFLPSFGWPIVDTSHSTALLFFAGFSHMFRMPLFFIVAGYFGRMMYHRRGAAGFVRDRARRIALPWILFWPPMVVTLAILMVWGAERSPFRETFPPLPALGVDTVPLTHLWFLYYLIWIYALALATRELVARVLDRSGSLRARIDAAVARLVSSGTAPLAFSAPMAAVAVLSPAWNPALGMPTPDHSLVPELVSGCGYSVAFGVGWLWQRDARLLQAMSRRIRSSLVLTFLCLVVAWGTGDAVARGAAPPAVRALAALCGSMAMWYFNTAVLGYAVRRFAAASAWTRYLADASYWLYIAHLPLVVALQGLVAPWPLHWSLKLLLIVAVTTALLLASYHYAVRATWLGALLNGRRRPRTLAASVDPEPFRTGTDVPGLGRPGPGTGDLTGAG